MKRYKWITSLLALFSVVQLSAQQQVGVPRLVVVVTVDQLRSDYLQYFGSTFGSKGFKRLMQEGMYAPEIKFDFPNLSKTSAVATLLTGSNPRSHGIAFPTLYRELSVRGAIGEFSILQDPDYMGNYTDERYSPKKLLASTFSDELAVASQMRSRIFAVAPDAETAIIGAGHAGNGAFWIDNLSGVWASTTYYNDMPFAIEKYNREESLAKKADKIGWLPSLPVSQYKAFPYSLDEVPFHYTFSKKDDDRFEKLKTTPFVNTEVTNIAKLLIDQYELGTKEVPDYLSVNYYAGNYLTTETKEYSIEIQDLYYRLDLELEELLFHLNQKVGLHNTLICIVGTGYYNGGQEIPETARVSKGEFFPDRCTALLNMYLMILYGQEPWVTGYNNQQIFLNRGLIEEKKLPLEEMQKKAAEFVIQFEGVQEVSTNSLLFYGNTNDQRVHFREGMHKSIVGDLQLHLEPGWSINYGKFKSNHIRHNAALSPFFLFGTNIQTQTIGHPVDATEIASTLSQVLRIRPPNACTAPPMREFIYPINK